MKLAFSVPGNPLSQNMVYRRRRGYGLYMTPQGHSFKEAIAIMAKLALPAEWVLAGAFDVELINYFRDLRQDCNGPIKLELDALEGVVYRKDSQVRDYTARKRLDRQNPRLEVIVWALTHQE